MILNPVNPKATLIANMYSNDEKYVYYGKGAVKKIIKGADINTFEIISYFYSKDKNHVYFCEKVLKGDKGLVRASDFVYICKNYDGEDYYGDKYNVFYYGKIIKGTDPKTFKSLSVWPYNIDKNHVYYNDRIIPYIDVKTFKVLNSKFAKDKNHVYILGYEIRPDDEIDIIDKRFDAISFKVFSDGTFGDKNHYCENGK